MAFHFVLFWVLSVAAVQCSPAWSFGVPGLFGSSGTIQSTSGSNTAEAGVSFENGAITGKIQLGPLGGIQSRIVGPVLPQIGEIAKNVQDGIGSLSNSVGTFFSNAIDNSLSMIGLPKFDLWTRVIDAQTFLVNGILTNIGEIVNNAGGLLPAAANAGALTPDQITSIASAFVKSAYENVFNPLAGLIDGLQSAVEQNTLRLPQAIELLREAFQNGFHTAEGMSESALNSFLDAATNAQTISRDVADRLRAFITSNFNAGARTGGKTVYFTADTNGDNKPDVNFGVNFNT